MHIVKSILAISMSFYFVNIYGQSYNETITNFKSDVVIIDSDYPDIVIKSWDGNEIRIESEVYINDENQNEALSLQTKNTRDGVYIDASVNTKSLEQKVMVVHQDGSKSYFDTNGFDNSNLNQKDYASINIGYNIDAKIVLLIPSNMKVQSSTVYGDINSKGKFTDLMANSTYGMIEAEVIKGTALNNLELVSTYDIVDLTIDPNIDADLKMSSSYGEIYSDLNIENKGSSSKNECGKAQHYILNEGGAKLNLVSTYDNIYIRAKRSL